MKAAAPSGRKPAARCPTCRKAFDPEASRFRPFCCERCKLIDLGRWLDGDYALPGEPASEEDMARAEEAPDEEPKRRR